MYPPHKQPLASSLSKFTTKHPKSNYNNNNNNSTFPRPFLPTKIPLLILLLLLLLLQLQLYIKDSYQKVQMFKKILSNLLKPKNGATPQEKKVCAHKRNFEPPSRYKDTEYYANTEKKPHIYNWKPIFKTHAKSQEVSCASQLTTTTTTTIIMIKW